MKNKGSIGLAKWSAGLLILVLGFVFSLVYVFPAEGADQDVILLGPDWTDAPNPNYQIMFSITNADPVENISVINITLPNGFVYITGSNFTTASNVDFSNSSVNVTWTNQTAAPVIPAQGGSHNFSFNVSIPNVPAVYTFVITTIDDTGVANSSYVNFTVNLPFWVSPMQQYAEQCGGDPCPAAVNTSKTIDTFFYDGNTIYLVVNFTNQNGGVPGLNVTGNFSTVGGEGMTYATYLGNGLYELNGTINYSLIPNGVKNIQPVNVTINATNTTDWSYYQTLTVQSVLLVNMSTLGCPPENDPNVFYPAVPGYNESSGSPVTDPVQAVGCTQNATLCQYMDIYGPGIYNGTDWLVCAPQFGPKTTNFNEVADGGNFSNVNLVIEVLGKALINFTQGVDFNDQQKAAAIMEFAMKNLMGAGKVGINDSEWNGVGGRPNLTISARLTLYNLSGLLGLTDPAIGYGEYAGPQVPENISTCPPTRCADIVWDGENLTFTVSTFSTYIAGDTLHNLTFVNDTALTSTIVTNQVTSYIITITNNGNATSETYNLSVVGIGTLNVSSITLNQGESTQVELNVSNTTAGQYTSYIVAYHYNGTDTETDWNLSSADDNVTFTTTIVNPSLTIFYPPNGWNITSTNGVDLNFSSNTVLDTCVYSINGTANVSIPNCANLTIGAGNFTEGVNQNITIYYNDTYGNGGSGLTLYTRNVFSIDNTAPEFVAITTHVNGQNVTGTITVNASVTDSVTGVYSVQLQITNSTGSLLNTTSMTEYDSAGNYTATVDTSQYSDGLYNLTIVATDYSNNVNSSYYINLTFDNTAPAVSIISPINGDYRKGSVLINVSASDTTTDVDTVRYNISNTTWSNVVEMSLSAAPYYNATLDTTTLQDGSYTITILANNTAGVINNTESVTITVDNTAPQLSNWTYSFITQQLTLNFNDVIDISSIILSYFDVTWNDGSVALDGLTGATVHTSSNSSSIVINFTTLQDNVMRDLRSKRDSSEGKIDMLVGSVKDRAGNNVTAATGLAYNSYVSYGIEIDLTGSVWNSFNLPRTVLENRTSLGGNYSVTNVLSSIAGNYQMIYYYDGSSWTSYVPGRITNDFTTFTDDTGINRYWIYMTTGDKLQIL
jgi:hypothetical protein